MVANKKSLCTEKKAFYTRSAPAVVYRGYYYEKNLCVMITHYNVFRRFFRTIYIVAIIYEQIMNSQLTFRLFAQLFYIF